jgi:putative transposase
MYQLHFPHDARHPLHLTLRVQRGLPSLRRQVVFVALRRALVKASHEGFRIVHFSVQLDHVHLMIEARDKAALSSGTAGLSIRIARAANKCLGRRGRFWADRYHARALRKPREVRNAMVYVLANWRKHVPRSQGLDSRSSAWWFTGWATPPPGPPPLGWEDGEPAPVHLPQTWLARVGWQRGGLVRSGERPQSAGKKRLS